MLLLKMPTAPREQSIGLATHTRCFLGEKEAEKGIGLGLLAIIQVICKQTF